VDTPDFASGGLLAASFARPGKLFTAHAALIVRMITGVVKSDEGRDATRHAEPFLGLPAVVSCPE
jgi:hypothetical protein